MRAAMKHLCFPSFQKCVYDRSRFFFCLPPRVLVWRKRHAACSSSTPLAVFAAKLCSDGATHERTLPRVICSQTPWRFLTKYQICHDSTFNQPQHWRAEGNGEMEAELELWSASSMLLDNDVAKKKKTTFSTKKGSLDGKSRHEKARGTEHLVQQMETKQFPCLLEASTHICQICSQVCVCVGGSPLLQSN